jgi:hypothetical protein
VSVIPRQFVGSVTAACVLLCNILCACGSHSGGAVENTKAAVMQVAAPVAKKSHCPHHGHHRHEDHVPPVEPTKDTGPGGGMPHHNGHDGGSGCQHCEGSVAAPAGKVVDAFTLAASTMVGFAPHWGSYLGSQTSLSTPAIAGDLPPPIAHPTLLSLGCALIR